MEGSSSELRRNLVSGEWVVIATGRAKRPQEFIPADRPKFKQARSGCPFEKSQENSVLVYTKSGAKTKKKNWWVEVVPNKYPAFTKGLCPNIQKRGIFEWVEGIGFHEVVVTRDHNRPLAKMTAEEIELIIRAYQERFLEMKKDACVQYVSIFHNSGIRAGATIQHPHSQIMAIPVIPPDVNRSLRGSEIFFNQNRECVHCAILRNELEAKNRLIYENEQFLVIAPFASKTAFECRIFPKIHNPDFVRITPEQRIYLAQALKTTLTKLYKGLADPDYNFFIHTSPTKNEEKHHHYHWHLEILPKTAVWAGFEISTGIEISVIAPEEAAEFLKNIEV